RTQRRHISSKIMASHDEQSIKSQSDAASKQLCPLNCNDLNISPEAKVILDLIDALANDSFGPESFDYKALSNFFAKPTINIPNEWAPMMSEITNLVSASLDRFPELGGIHFKC
ncbi:hypothetical protein PENTCL1PPCAC_29827, partial [Pristionchus entomophagus]